MNSYSKRNNSFLKIAPGVALGLGTGALVAYFADPTNGRHRRALVRDQLIHFSKIARRKSIAQAHHVRNRLLGLTATARSALSKDNVSDEILIARVASKIGRVVSNPHSIEIIADDGIVFLSGPIFKDEIDDLISIAMKVKGVKVIDNQLKGYERHERVPGLQGLGYGQKQQRQTA